MACFRENIQRLPEPILYLIQAYIHNPQSKILLNDIENFNETKKFILEYYYNKFIHMSEFDKKFMAKNEDKKWLANDIINYLNRGCNRFSFHQRFYDLWQRNVQLFTMKKRQKFADRRHIVSQYSLRSDTQNLHYFHSYILNQPNEMIKEYVRILEHKQVTSEINFYWGLMSPEERKQFIEYIL